MKAEICGVCLKSDMLCASCQEKLDSGEITQEYVDAIRKINSVLSESKGLKDVEIKKIIKAGKFILLLCSKQDVAKLIGVGGFIVKKLERELGKPVQVTEESSDIRQFLQNLIFPVPILSVGEAYTPDGEKIRARVPADKKLPISPKTFSEIGKAVFGKDVEVVFEGEAPKNQTTEEKIKKLLKRMGN